MLQEKLKQKLEDLEQKGYISKVNEPTEWVSSLVVVRKENSDKLRICIDPTNLNRAIKRHHYQMPNIEDIVTKLKKAKIFSVLDAKDGFWQVKLTEESSYLTTFQTPFGRFRWTVLPFGIKSAPEVFQMRMSEALEGLQGVAVVADDILVYGEGDTKEEALEDHERNLRGLLERCIERKIKLNETKLKLRKDEITYIGQLLTSSGVKPDPKKIKAIQDLKSPSNKAELK